jgi:hypothetical protein
METLLQATVIGSEASGESFVKLHLFSAEGGYRLALQRRAGKSGKSRPPDLFEEVECLLRQTRESSPCYIVECTASRSRANIAKSWQSFENASYFCQTLRLNATHMPHPESVHLLLQRCLDAWERLLHPECILLKALYRLACEEGLPAKASWLEKLPSATRESAHFLLHTPLEGIRETVTPVADLNESLIRWLRHQQDFIMPDRSDA